MTLRLAIWDLDGTVVDSREVIQTAMVRAFEEVGLAPPAYDATRRIVGLSLHEACARLAPEGLDGPALDALVDAYRRAFVARRAEPGFKEPLYLGAVPTLERLAREGWLMGVATGKSRRGVASIFEAHDLARCFDTVWCADDGPGKPHPFMVLEAMKAVGAESDAALLIGDSVFDVQMSRAAGVAAHGVSWGFGEAAELIEAGAHAVHHDFESLNAALDLFAAA